MSERSPAAAWLALALLAGTLALVAVRLRPPPARPATAAATEFSALRAAERWTRLCPEERPRPVGSPEHERLRERLRAELTTLGLAPVATTGFVCGRFGACGTVTNLLARLPGALPDAILLVTHYDSVPAGPGAADSGINVAALLEIARALRAGPPLRHPVLLLFTDGEELGMLGAQAFAQQAPEAKSVLAAVNLDARGTGGPSHVFRLGPGSAALWPALALPRPVSSSLEAAAFRLLPSDTDLSALMDAGIRGFDFAFIDGFARYHTPDDALAHLDLGSVQHQGEGALALIRALDARGLPTAAGDAVYFDLFAWRVVGWPVGAALPLAVTVLVASALAMGALRRRRRLTASAGWVGLVAWPALVLGTSLLTGVCHLVLGAAGALPFPWIAHPAPAMVAVVALAIATTLAGVALTSRAGGAALWLGHQLFGAVGAGLTAVAAPEVSYLFLVPAAAGALGAGLWAAAPVRHEWVAARAAWMLPLVATAVVVGPVALGLPAAMGLAALPAHGVLALWLALPAAPALVGISARRLGRGALLATGVALAALLTAALVPTASRAVPRRTSLAHLTHADGAARYLADTSWGPLDPVVFARFAFTGAEASPPWVGSLRSAVTAPAPQLDLEGPAVTVLERAATATGRRIRARVASRRGARVIDLVLPEPANAVVHLDGEPSPGLPLRSGRHHLHVTVPPTGFALELEVAGTEPLPALLVDSSPGLPPTAAELAKARDSLAATSHFGDATVVVSAITF